MDIMAQRGRPKGSKNNSASLPTDVIAFKLDSIEAKLDKNSKDIEELKHQVSMGRGGIKVIFLLGALIAAVATALGYVGVQTNGVTDFRIAWWVV